MEPAVLSGKPASGLVDKPVRLSPFVSFRGEQRTLPGEPPFPAHSLDRLAPLPLVDLSCEEIATASRWDGSPWTG
ncbi:hypothetical protein ACFW93_23950 [Streptomyces canus]|uniref:hypothetical protein n=1 Tax=Streptomyces canus TaxID=58343 RepID=UPI0036980C97